MSAPLSPLRTCRRSAGFTLIEAVIVIVITGVLASVVAVFIVKPVESYLDSVRRAELTEQADLIARRVEREVHSSLPNSLRIRDSSGHVGSCAAQPSVICYIEFILTSGGGRYRAVGDGSTAGNVLSFNPASPNLTFDVIGPMPMTKVPVSDGNVGAGDFIVVYNLEPGNTPADAYASGDACTNCNRAKISSVSGNTVTLTSNPFAAQSPPLPSPSNRFQVVSGNVRAVSYACPTVTPGNLQRYQNYGFSSTQATPPGVTPALMSSHARCNISPISVLSGAQLLTFTLTLYDPTDSESVSLFREIYVDNVP